MNAPEKTAAVNGKNHDPTRQLIRTIVQGEGQSIGVLASLRADVNAYAPDAMLPPELPGGRLLHAALCGWYRRTSRSQVEQLLDAGADPKLTSRHGANALHYLCAAVPRGGACWEDARHRVRLVERLVAKGVDVNQAAAHGQTPLHCALDPLMKSPAQRASVRLVQALIDAGADPNAQREDGVTPLAQALCSDGADEAKTEARALDALVNGNRILEILLKAGADANGNWPRGPSAKSAPSPLLCAALHQLGSHAKHFPEAARERVALLLENGADPNRSEDTEYGSPLAIALSYFHSGACALLLHHGADANGPAGQLLPPLVQASMFDDDAGPEDYVLRLLSHGADPNVREDTGGTALDAAARRLNDRVASLLIAAGADVNARGAKGNTALHWTARNGGARGLELSRLLIEYGADPLIRNEAGETPADVLDRRHDELKALYAQGAQEHHRPIQEAEAAPGL